MSKNSKIKREYFYEMIDKNNEIEAEIDNKMILDHIYQLIYEQMKYMVMLKIYEDINF